MEFGEHFDYKSIGIEDFVPISSMESFGSQSDAAFFGFCK